MQQYKKMVQQCPVCQHYKMTAVKWYGKLPLPKRAQVLVSHGRKHAWIWSGCGNSEWLCRYHTLDRAGSSMTTGTSLQVENFKELLQNYRRIICPKRAILTKSGNIFRDIKERYFYRLISLLRFIGERSRFKRKQRI
jgi:hypothetical protein